MHQLFLAFILLCFLGDFPATVVPDVSINCGGTGASAASDGQEWSVDANPKLSSSLLQIKGSSIASGVSRSFSSCNDPVPYGTARISRSKFSYEFQVNPGEKIVRLHFNSAPYEGFTRFMDFFDVEFGRFTLLSNFSASFAAHALGVNAFVKEFCIKVAENQLLSLIFSSASRDTYAFINGIEIISVPSARSYFRLDSVGVEMGGESNTAFEIIRRLNIRKESVLREFEMWETVPQEKRRKINNATWRVSVDVGFRYLVRLYYNTRESESQQIGDFKILINEMIACTNIDLIGEWDGNDSVAWHRDFRVIMDGCKHEGKRDILIQLETCDNFMEGHEPLQGFEVIKMSNPDNSLAAPNPMPPVQNSPYFTVKSLFHLLGGKNAVVFFAIAILCLLNAIICILLKIGEAYAVEKENMPLSRAERLCHRFSLAEIRLATENFSDVHFIGRGGFGKVYKGLIDKGKQTVAIKRLNVNSRQGAYEFLTEIETLTEVRHVNLVSLIGYCSEYREMVLVYEYMPCGTLADHLYKQPYDSEIHSSLTWKQRINICIGAGRGLDYLHTGCSLIHRDVKTSNILLNQDFTPKISDFGLAKCLYKYKLCSHVSTKVKGTFGYWDPAYVSTGRLSPKSDTYAFGVVLLEVLCGRPAVDSTGLMLSTWAQENIGQGRAEQIVASDLKEEISMESLMAFVEIVESCLHKEQSERPTMAEVVLQLEYVHQLQISTTEIKCEVDGVNPLKNDVNTLVGRKQVAMPSSDHNREVNLAPDQFQLENERKFLLDKPSQLWPWNAFWKRQQNNDLKVPAFSLFLKGRRQRQKFFLQNEASLLHDNYHTSRSFEPTELDKVKDTFKHSRILAKGGCATVYKGVLSDDTIIVVKKPINPNQIEQSINEVIILSPVKHKNVVKRRGGCFLETKVPDLVYELEHYGTLLGDIGSILHVCFQFWIFRLRIATEIAGALSYLHTNNVSPPIIIHGDVKSENILLDHSDTAKVFNFGASKLVSLNDSKVTAMMRGTSGYLDQSYHLTEKSDVYRFGVVLVELLTGMKAVNLSSSREHQSLGSLFQCVIKQGREHLFQLIGENTLNVMRAERIREDEIIKFAEVAESCLRLKGEDRPDMKDVTMELEGLLERRQQYSRDKQPPDIRNLSWVSKNCDSA